jgi:hypothetical protein
MDSELFHELIAQARGMAATLREAEHKLAAVTAELAQREHEARPAGRTPELLPGA